LKTKDFQSETRAKDRKRKTLDNPKIARWIEYFLLTFLKINDDGYYSI